MAWYPLHVRLDGRMCLVVGGGPIAVRKARGLIAGGASVKVVAPSVCPEMISLVEAGEVELNERKYREADLAGILLAITATDDPDVNAQVFVDCESKGVLVNSADDPSNCRFILPATIRRGDLTISVSTGGASPALAAILKRRLESDIGEEWGILTKMMADARDTLHDQGRSTEGMGDKWSAVASEEVLELLRSGDLDAARKRISDCLS